MSNSCEAIEFLIELCKCPPKGFYYPNLHINESVAYIFNETTNEMELAECDTLKDLFEKFISTEKASFFDRFSDIVESDKFSNIDSDCDWSDNESFMDFDNLDSIKSVSTDTDADDFETFSVVSSTSSFEAI